MNNDEIESILNRCEQSSKSIDSVNLSNRELKILPNRLSTLLHLRSLYLDNNKLIFIPEIGSLIQLEELSLENNELTLLPESFSNLRSLKTLNLSKNNLKCLNGAMFKNFEQLVVLWLNECGLMYLPNEIGCLNSLEKLGLKSNKLEEIPVDFGRLVKLRWLSLENNLLCDLPVDEFKKLTELNHLNLSGNKLESVPEFLSGLKKSLNVVSLRNNRIRSFHDADVLELSYLTKIDLRDNPFLAAIKENNVTFYNELKTLSNFIFSDDE